MRKSPYLKTAAEESSPGGTPQSINSTSANAGTPPDGQSPMHGDVPETVGSPFKRHRASMQGLGAGMMIPPLESNGASDEFLPASALAPGHSDEKVKVEPKVDSDEEL